MYLLYYYNIFNYNWNVLNYYNILNVLLSCLSQRDKYINNSAISYYIRLNNIITFMMILLIRIIITLIVFIYSNNNNNIYYYIKCWKIVISMKVGGVDVDIFPKGKKIKWRISLARIFCYSVIYRRVSCKQYWFVITLLLSLLIVLNMDSFISLTQL